MAEDQRRRYGEKYGEAEPPLPRRGMIAGAENPGRVDNEEWAGVGMDTSSWGCWALGRTEAQGPVCQAQGRYMEPGRHRHSVCAEHYVAIRRGELTSQYTSFDWTGSHG